MGIAGMAEARGGWRPEVIEIEEDVIRAFRDKICDMPVCPVEGVSCDEPRERGLKTIEPNMSEEEPDMCEYTQPTFEELIC